LLNLATKFLSVPLLSRFASFPILKAEEFTTSSLEPMDCRYVEPLWVSHFTFYFSAVWFLIFLFIALAWFPSQFSINWIQQVEALLNQLIIIPFVSVLTPWFIIFRMGMLTWFPSRFDINLNGE
jgi:hypothetical protein